MTIALATCWAICSPTTAAKKNRCGGPSSTAARTRIGCWSSTATRLRDCTSARHRRRPGKKQLALHVCVSGAALQTRHRRFGRRSRQRKRRRLDIFARCRQQPINPQVDRHARAGRKHTRADSRWPGAHGRAKGLAGSHCAVVSRGHALGRHARPSAVSQSARGHAFRPDPAALVTPQAVSAVAQSLRESYLFIQGPPGSGKSTTGSQVICDLLRPGSESAC